MSTRFRYVTPVPVKAATGRVAEVYAQQAAGFGLRRMPVFMTLSPAPDLQAATWALVRESLLAGHASRVGKEVVAAEVSRANRCPYCVAAHTALLHATGAHRLAEAVLRGETPGDPGHAALVAWAGATRGRQVPAAPFPPEHAAEYLGTALAFHFINRVASALLTEDVLPGGAQRLRAVRVLAGWAVARATRRPVRPGEGLRVLAGLPAAREPRWAAGTPIGVAYATLRAAADAGGELLGDAARAAVRDAVAGWDGEHPPLGDAWLGDALAGVPAADRPAARLALLAACAPYRVGDADVRAWRAGHPSDADLVRLVAFGAITAVERFETAIQPAAA